MYKSNLSLFWKNCDLIFLLSESRRILLPVVLHHIHLHLRQQKELLICSGILSSIFSIIKTSSLVICCLIFFFFFFLIELLI